ncbi:acyl-CoA N-acyltransferase [Apiospora marii]|uniref:Acyl-CoA N-acyltransferase n=1 Tax=Apiospora marii TaxID=335849 RepID=A0ABR1S7A7_9PEZI
MTIRQSSSVENPSHDIKVESASIEDANAMADVGARSFDSMGGQSVPDADLEAFMAANYSASAMIAELKDPVKLTLVARTEDNDAVVGIIQLKLYVDPSMHGKGVGTRLICALEERARAEGFKQIWLTVWEENPKAHRLYERLGYGKAGETGFWLGTLRQNDWVYLKAL